MPPRGAVSDDLGVGILASGVIFVAAGRPALTILNVMLTQCTKNCKGEILLKGCGISNGRNMRIPALRHDCACEMLVIIIYS